ncbi:MAG: MBL fold metallo-hydrolase [Mailhella sp.]|nr:MBL fold metallo-hydrolase [Mailhella sp.]
MPVITIPFGMLEANCHIVHNGRDAVVFDPADDTDAILKAVAREGVQLRGAALTHLHADHCLGCAAFSRATGLLPAVGREDWDERELLLCRGMCFGMDMEPFSAVPVSAGRISWGSLECEALHAPGHSPGSLCYYFAALGIVITGDVLFYRSVGRSDLPGGNTAQLMDSIRGRIYALPDETQVYPGHGPETSVGDEKRLNPFCPGH